MRHGQPNWIVPTPPSGDSSHRVADTEFVATGLTNQSSYFGTELANLSAFVSTSISSSAVTSYVASVTASTGLAQTNTTGNVTLRASLTSTTASLSGDVTCNNTAAYFDGPSVAQGTTGTWFVSGTVTSLDTVAPTAIFYAKLWDGATVIDSGGMIAAAVSGPVSIALSGYISSPAGNLRISVRDVTSDNGLIKFNTTGNSKDSTITAVRIA